VSRKVIVALVLLLAGGVLAWAEDGAVAGPKLLLNAQRLRRLKRDRERKTTRWVSFENRVNGVPDSPERGFELALYYVVTGDEAKGRAAVSWVLSHNKDARQLALVLDWCGSLLSADQKKSVLDLAVAAMKRNGIQGARDAQFSAIASGITMTPTNPNFLRRQLDLLIAGRFQDASELYALFELIYAVRASTHTDLREIDAHFFSTLPELLLLSAKPSQMSSPDWHMHAAALALVTIDPNLPASQFLQSWALEDAQTLREGPGVAYELLWADPYLPGVGYQNMDPWLYDEQGRLVARAGWEPTSCWAAISAHGVEQENCPANWQSETVTFGHLTLIPMKEHCVEIPHLTDHNDSVLVWELKPGEKMVHGKGKDQHTSEADAAGIWRPGGAVEGKVCIATH
jgi:hypothetical protein